MKAAAPSHGRKLSWAAFTVLTVLFALLCWAMALGSIIAGGCNPTSDLAKFAACDIAVGHLQRGLPWTGLAIPIAIPVEWRWRWGGSVLLIVVAVAIIVMVRRVYA